MRAFKRKKLQANLFLVFVLIFIISIFCSCKKIEPLENEVLLSEGWEIQAASEVKESGEVISGPEFETVGWNTTPVPSTVLAALVRNGVYSDIFFGKNLEGIPREQFQQPWWYRKEFVIKSNQSFEHAWLVFEGINYRANVYLNGKKLASSSELWGAFRIFELDVTDKLVAGKNVLAVEVIPPQPGDFTIGFVDWNPRPPDENMGLWREAKLRMSGPVSLNNPFVQSDINLETLQDARLTISAELRNHSDRKVSGILEGKILDILFSRSFTLESNERKKIVFSPEEHDVLVLENPHLWWPNNLGESRMYDLELTAVVANKISDKQATRFGIREVSDYINAEGHRGYKINGREVLIRGGGWVDDLLLVEEPGKLEAQFQYARHMHLNTIRLEGFWGSSHRIYDLADKYGILLMAGWSCHWEWEDYLGKPADKFGGIQTEEEMELISRSLRDQVVWLRNHPSIFVWVLGSDMLPRPALEERYNASLSEIDPTRPTLAACGYSESEISGPTAVKMNGPYDYVTPNYWYVDKKRGGAYGFNTETGPGPQPPPLESLKKMLPEDHLWPIDEYWDYHCARNEFNSLNRYLLAFHSRYGKPLSVEEFTFKAQAANYEAIRAMFEAFGVNKPTTTGIIQWMYNSAWPKMFWQLFDYFLMPNGAFYGTRTACEPLNIVFNYGDKNIYVVNDTHEACENLRAEIRVLNLESKVVFSEELSVGIGEYLSKKILDMPRLEGLSSVYFFDLKLKDKSGEKISDNFYWLSTKEDVLDEDRSTWFYTPSKAFADFSGLDELQEVRIHTQHEFEDLGEDQEIQVILENPTDKLAFFIELNVYGKESGQSILPIFWEDNYVSLLPGEVKKIKARFVKADLGGDTPAFRLKGWNVKTN
ncbi:MAG: sugar-binding domain-containing protein [Candidatus Aminicenantaceae bacterium]